MCGLFVYLGNDTVRGRALATRGMRMLAQRGPDDEGLFAGNGAVLAHRRLCIVDLTYAGHQPMSSPDGRWTIVYNGEVYNHLEIRDRLCTGWTFHSRTDSETVLAALALNGPAVLAEMVGMWAFALLDNVERRLFFSWDRYGQKPLYWRRSPDGGLRIASEIAPLFDDGESPAMYAPAVAAYLSTGNYGHLGERTFFRDVYSFPPAHWAWIGHGDDSPSPVRFWRYPTVPNSDREPYDAGTARRFRDAFERAVSLQLMSDVPVGVTLSGGIDSSAVVGTMASATGAKATPVFSAQAEGSAYDESRYVRAVEARFRGRVDVHWVKLEQMRASQILAPTIEAQEEPFGDPSIAAHGMLMDAAKAARVPVILGGQGSDEMLFGYHYLGNTLLAASLRRGRIGWVASEARALGLGWPAIGRVGLAATMPATERRARPASRARRRSWLSDSLRSAAHGTGADAPCMRDIGGVSVEAVERTALPHLTHYDDRSGMRRSLEGRMPFLDHRLADIVATLREDAFRQSGRLKRILRDSCGDLLPAEVVDRRDKIGFFTPLRAMLQAEQDWARRLLTDEFAHTLDLYDFDVVRACVDSLGTGKGRGDAAHVVWRAMSVRVWAEMFNVRVGHGALLES